MRECCDSQLKNPPKVSCLVVESGQKGQITEGVIWKCVFSFLALPFGLCFLAPCREQLSSVMLFLPCSQSAMDEFTETVSQNQPPFL